MSGQRELFDNSTLNKNVFLLCTWNWRPRPQWSCKSISNRYSQHWCKHWSSTDPEQNFNQHMTSRRPSNQSSGCSSTRRLPPLNILIKCWSVINMKWRVLSVDDVEPVCVTAARRWRNSVGSSRTITVLMRARILQWRAQTKSGLYVNVLTRVTAQQTGPARCRTQTSRWLYSSSTENIQTLSSHRSQPDSIQIRQHLKNRPSVQLRLSCGDIIPAFRHQDQTPLHRQEVHGTGRHAFKCFTKIKAHRIVLREMREEKSNRTQQSQFNLQTQKLSKQETNTDIVNTVTA